MPLPLKDAAGTQMVDLIKGNGMVPGIKLDKGYSKDGLCNTKVGPLGHPETWTKGLDDLEARCAQAYAQGARFAKWRNVLQIDPTTGIPSDAAVDECVTSLARYAAICQRQRLVPIVEPEIVPNGSHGKYINMIFRGALEAFLNKKRPSAYSLVLFAHPFMRLCLPPRHHGVRGGDRARALGAVQGAPDARCLPRGRGPQAQHG